MNNNNLLMIVLAFVVGYMLQSMMKNMCGNMYGNMCGNMCGNRLFEGSSVTITKENPLPMKGSSTVALGITNNRDGWHTFNTDTYQTSPALRLAGIKGLSFQKSNSIAGATGRLAYGITDSIGDFFSKKPNKGKNTNLLLEVDPIDSMADNHLDWDFYLKKSADSSNFDYTDSLSHSTGSSNKLNFYDVWDTSTINKIDYDYTLKETPYITLHFDDNYPEGLKTAANTALNQLGRTQMSNKNSKSQEAVKVHFDYIDGRLWLSAIVNGVNKKVYLNTEL